LKEGVTGRRGRRRKKVLDELKGEKKRVLEIGRGSTISHSVEKLLCKKLWTCLETDYRMNGNADT